MSSSRQLAAIMFTDIVGYTRLMGDDEHRALQVLEQSRQIQRPIILQYNGRWIKELGDGVLTSFPTVTDAVNAAIAIQRACNAAQSFKLRIGIHLGEIVFEDGDVFGDGVNIASRIQSNAHPGSIFISEAVKNSISNKKEFQLKFFKEEKLKNVRQPINVYQVIADGVVTATMGLTEKVRSRSKIFFIAAVVIVLTGIGYWIVSAMWKSKLHADERSIAILPFTDLSPEKDQAYLGDGLADEIINSISIISNVKVIGSTSSFKYRGEKLDLQSIGRELNVSNVLEGSIQKSGDIIRIITKLVRVSDNRTLWSKRFENTTKDIFAVQDTIANRIVEALKITLSDNERPRLAKKETDPEVYSLYLKGLYTYKAEEYDKSIAYNLQAIAIDSQFAPSYAYVALAKTWNLYRSNTMPDADSIKAAKDYANRAIRLNTDLAEGYSALALLAWRIEVDFITAKQNFERSIQLNPSASLIKNRYAYFLLWMGEFDKAERLAKDAIDLDPADYNGYLIVAHANIYKKNFTDAEKYIAEGQKLFPANPGLMYMSLLRKYLVGAYDEVISTVAPLVDSNVEKVQSYQLVLLSLSYHEKGKNQESERITDLLKERVNDPTLEGEYSLARVYAQTHQLDSAIGRLENSFEKQERGFHLLKIDPLLEPVKQDSHYLDLYRKYGFDRYR